MRIWAKTIFRIVGVANILLAAIGIYGIAWAISRAIKTSHHSPEAPYFDIAFATMTAINVGFLLLFLIAAFQLVTLRGSGVMWHSITALFLLVYMFLNGALWLIGQGVGRSIGSASGIGNMGIAPFSFFVPFVYPIASSILLLVTRWKGSTSG